MARYPDWPQRLNKYLVGVKAKQIVYGEHDCCTFAAGAVMAMTGEDPMAEFRGRYSSKGESDDALREIGAGDLYRTLRRKFGPPVKGCRGRKGDIAFHEGACGIVIGRFAIVIGEEGLATVGIRQLDRAFRLPE